MTAQHSPPDVPVLRVRNLRTTFETREGPFRAVDDVEFEVGRGKVFSLVGESGCGKSVTAFSIMRLPGPGGSVEGEAVLEGTNLLELSEREMRQVRGGRISIVFQNPLNALNPALKIGDQIAEVIRAHADSLAESLGRPRSLLRPERRRGRVWERVIEVLGEVGMPSPARNAERFPHQLSGGMRQRAVIAAALACEPRLIIADEPTTALDVTVQRQIVLLLDRVRREADLSILLISHDFALVAEVADRTAVMYAGQIVERSDTDELVRAPRHPYTRALLDCVPTLEGRGRLTTIAGSVPDRYDLMEGCRFSERCPESEPRCREEAPAMRQMQEGHWVRCHLA